MNSELCNALVHEIGSMIVSSDEYREDDWLGIAVVIDFSFGQQSQHGYAYLNNGDFQARSPGFDVLRKIRDLREQMKKEKSIEWHQCLIHITRPDYKINFQFEYHDPERWSIKKISRDMSEYAESLKPQTEVST